MKKWYVFLCSFILIFGVHTCDGQPREKITEFTTGLQVETGPIPGANGSETYTREFTTNENVVTERAVWTKNSKGEWTFKHETFSEKGILTGRTEESLELKDGKLVVKQYKYTIFRPDGKVSSTEGIGEYGPDGVFRQKEIISGPKKTPDIIFAEESVERMNKCFTPPFQNDQPQPKTDVSTIGCGLNFLPQGGVANCSQRIVLSFGPSYLKRDFGPEKETCIGAHVIANYNFSRNFGAGVDLSMFKKKVIEDEELTTTLILANAEYRLWNQKKDCQPISVFSRIAIGLMREKLGDMSETESGTALGAGLALRYKLSKKFRLGLTGDYLYASLNDQKINMLRFSLLLSCGFMNFK